MNIAVSAEEAAGVRTLQGLLERGHSVAVVLASPGTAARVGRSVWAVARELGLPVWPSTRLRDPGLAEELRDQGVDVLLNVHSLEVIDQRILQALPLGGYNLHPAPLPRYAGLHSVSWAIYHGEREHGVTVHRMTAEVDAGPIAFQVRFPIAPGASALEVSSMCARLGVPMMFQLADLLAIDPTSVPAIEQNPAERHWYGRTRPHDGRLDWRRSAAEVVDLVRACDYHPFASPWGHPTTTVRGRRIEVLKASVTETMCGDPPGTVGRRAGGAVHVAARDAWVLVRTVRVDQQVLPAADVLDTGARLLTQDRPAPA